MSKINADEIRGYRIGSEEIVCPVCITGEEINSCTEDRIIIGKDIEHSGQLWFCDRCKKGL